jgi:hypothetical protein
MTLYKVTNLDGTPSHGGSGKWSLPRDGRPGKWMLTIEALIPCESGYHLCDGELQLLEWLGPAIWIAEAGGKRIDDSNKVVVQRARLVERVRGWTEIAARLFACDCAEHTLHLFERVCDDPYPRIAIETARASAVGEASDEDGVAARAAARAAAGDAAWDAERRWQAERLRWYLDGCPLPMPAGARMKD